MASIGGLTIKDACVALDISRQSMHRYRKDDAWPGDDAPWAHIQAFVSVKRGPAGRRKKSAAVVVDADPAAQRTAPHSAHTAGSVQASTGSELGGGMDSDEQLDDEFNNLDMLLDLDKELKYTVIEKNKAQIAKYQQAAIAAFRDKLGDNLVRAFGTFFDEIADMDLTRTQLDNLRRALNRSLEAVTGKRDADDDQPELEL